MTARLSRTLLLLSLLTAAACGGGDGDSPPSSPPPSGSGDTITGRERFGWSQAGSASDAAILQFAVYVDGARRVLEGASCNPGGTSLECSAPLPPMTAGRHTLELAAFYVTGDTTLEGPKSTPLQVNIAGVTAGASDILSAAPPPPESGPVLSSDGSELAAEILAADLLDPVDVAVDGAGRTFVAERAGGIRILGRDRETTSGDRTDDLSSERDVGAVVLSLTLAPDFDESRFVYVLKAIPDAEASRLMVVRYREVEGRFGQAAVIASAALAGADPAGVIRFGPDGALYVGLGSRTAEADLQRPSLDGGRILRLTADGRTPRDNPGASPTYSSGHRDPSGLVWLGPQGTLWEVESGLDADELNAVRAGADYGWPSIGGRARLSAADAPAVPLRAGTGPSGMTVIRDDRRSLDSNLIVSSIGLQDLLRIEITDDGVPASGEPVRLLQGRFGAIGQVTAGPGGTLYLITRNRETWGAGRDAVVRLSPAPR